MTKLFSGFDLSGRALKNRIVMAPMTRARSPNDVASERVALYYAQRATAGLIVTEGTPISREGQGYILNPGIFSPQQIAGWRLTTDSVHAVGGTIFAQIWHVGRVSHSSLQENGQPPVSSTARIAKGAEAFAYDSEGAPTFVHASEPRALSTDEVRRVWQDFAQAATNADEAGFDGVEIHGANGYLFEQFLNPTVNDRTDEYAADTMENRLRFALETVDAVCSRIGSHRVGIRLSPYGKLFDMEHYPDIQETYTALAQELGKRKLAYVHFMDQSGYVINDTVIESISDRLMQLMGEFRKAMPGTALILAGGMTLERATKLLDDDIIDLAAFGQPFIANPDLVERLRNGWELNEPDRATYYGGDGTGLIDYPPYRRA